MVIGGWANVCVDMLPEVCMTVVVVMIILEGVVSASYPAYVRAETSSGIDVSIVARVGVFIGDLVDALVRTVNGVTVDGAVPGIDITADVDANLWANTMAGLEFVTFSASLADMLLF